jgi:serine protease Do
MLLLAMAGYHLPASRADDGGRTAWLGVYTQSLSAELRDALGHRGGGVLVNRVVDRSPADRAGIRKGDLIVRVNSESVDSPGELARVVQGRRVGDEVDIEILRDGDRQTLQATLAARDDEGESGSRARRGDHDFDDGDEDKSPDADQEKDFETPVPPPAPRELREGPDAPDVSMMLGMGQARLGVRIESLSPELGEYFDVKEGHGVLVLDVMKGSAAERTGLKPGDVIVRFDGRDINDSDDLIRAVRESTGRVDLIVVRHGSRRTFETELAAPRGQNMFRTRRGEGAWRSFGARPEVRRQLGGDREAMQRELRELREELKELKQDIEELKNR